MNDFTHDAEDNNALHAASTWLERVGAELTAAAIVTVAPSASVGLWQAGMEHVAHLPQISDAESELCEAVAPIAQRALDRLPEGVLAVVAGALVAGARLQVLLVPAGGDIAVRILHGGKAILLGGSESASPLN